MPFEVNLGSAFQVKDDSYVLYEQPEVGTPDIFPAPGPFPPFSSNMIVQTDQPLIARCRWRVQGGLALILTGAWRVKVFLEQFGGGEARPGEYEVTVPFVNALNHVYDVKVEIPAEEIGEGLYRIALSINMIGPAPDKLPLPVAGFAELGNVHYYTAH